MLLITSALGIYLPLCRHMTRQSIITIVAVSPIRDPLLCVVLNHMSFMCSQYNYFAFYPNASHAVVNCYLDFPPFPVQWIPFFSLIFLHFQNSDLSTSCSKHTSVRSYLALTWSASVSSLWSPNDERYPSLIWPHNEMQLPLSGDCSTLVILCLHDLMNKFHPSNTLLCHAALRCVCSLALPLICA